MHGKGEPLIAVTFLPAWAHLGHTSHPALSAILLAHIEPSVSVLVIFEFPRSTSAEALEGVLQVSLGAVFWLAARFTQSTWKLNGDTHCAKGHPRLLVIRMFVLVCMSTLIRRTAIGVCPNLMPTTRCGVN